MKLSFGGVDYLDRTHALATGEVGFEGVTLEFESLAVSELFRRMCLDEPLYDAGEMSLSTYMIMRSNGDDRYVGIPVFPARAFRHRQIYVNADAGIASPADLAGRRVGLREYQVTAALWMRGFLQHDHGVDPATIHWHYGGMDSPVWHERMQHALPPSISIERIPADRYLSEMLERGDLDAVLATHRPRPFEEGSPKVRRLFPDYVEVEADYYRRTGFHPIMHTVVVRREVYEANRWLAEAIYQGFEAAKRVGAARVRDFDILAVSDPWWEGEIERIDRLFGGDAYPYGLAANLATLEAATLYSFEQGLSARKLDPRELFVEELWST
jgi:4,5-dihydroxyphthalate decarboxylase